MLVHSARGVVDSAAVQIAQMLKATVYASVGTKDKVKNLEETLGNPRSRNLYSRDDSFLADLTREPDG